MTTIAGTNPYTGVRLDPVAEEDSPFDVDRIVESAGKAFSYLESIGRTGRAGLLHVLADSLDLNAEELIKAADEETGIGPARLTGELKRASYQMRFFAEVLLEGSYLEATIDTAGDTPMGPRPDLRRILQPIGPVAVFGSSNFPFAFSVIGGDTASALATGCPVVLKAHSSHPRTSKISYDIMAAATTNYGAPEGILGIVFGQKAGTALVSHPLIQAVGFTGSLGGGAALMEAISRRPQPIPFYGELSSLNPLIVTPNAASERGADIGAGLATSITTSAGQLCTKPGIVFVPQGDDGDILVSRLADDLAVSTVSPLLNRRIFESYAAITGALEDQNHVERVATGKSPAEEGFRVTPVVYSIDVSRLRRETVEECFGPSAIIVRYGTLPDLELALPMIEDSLTMTVHLGDGDDDLARRLTELGRARAGRIIYNGYPTGVSVSWAQTHGGPWPSTNSLHTSVGATAVRRFLRPVTYQDAPGSVLPDELKDGNLTVPTRVNGQLNLPQPSAQP
ncbi:aldehyde dehydrogenase (NADP(+)) [Paenarthrobacter nitroguajacolicus]|uniref:aldehyde dehydrogenase (NADP(+)) n=1 Tax=Paenarthrobacter nitroguajacolicus TaxID=211146 RepID=UPI0015BC8F8C|nr:aldehyde dehydrogenase (NADP(+)) [Paenarthrobacter nitroguajacolicus]NWL31980.1 aldehyde dehydrogenase (NADP(+)) [Paenarthrobacter nitroguajacolicus]